MVHRRELDGEEIVFGNQGDLWMNAMTWFDHDTGSVWSQPTGSAIMGPLAGRTLQLLPSSLATWADWRVRFPDTSALDTFTRAHRFSLDQMAVVAAVGDASIAVPIEELRREQVVSTELGGEPVVIVLDPEVDRWAAYSRRFGNRILELDLTGGSLTDRESGEAWEAVGGRSRTGGEALERVAAFSSFPADYVRLFPDGRILVGGVIEPASEYASSCGSLRATPTGCRTDG